MKLVNEIHKIFSDNSIKISSTCVRIPVLRSHSENIVVETKKEVDLKKFRNLLKKTKGVSLKDDIKKNIYPMPKNSTNKFDVEVGRIRHNLIFGKKSCEFFVSGDQLLKGAALNAFQIFKEIFNKK